MVIFTKLHSTILYSSMLPFFTLTTAATVREINPKLLPPPLPPSPTVVGCLKGLGTDLFPRKCHNLLG